MIVRARFLKTCGVPGGDGLVENAYIAVNAGRIDSLGSVRNGPTHCDVDFQDAVILPGLVNAHTHLELTHMHECVPPSPDFTDWLWRLVTHFRANPLDEERVASSVQRGIDLSLASGVTTIGDITREPQLSRPVLSRSPIQSLSFGEVIAIGLGRNRLAGKVADAVRSTGDSGRMAVGISPHAPYTIEAEGIECCAAAAKAQGLRTCMHLLETPDEEAFTRDASGAYNSYLKRLGVWDEDIPASAVAPVELIASCGLLNAECLLAHMNYVDDKDMARLARSKASVAFCPRTHAAFGHPPHRFRDMQRAGINVCIGTDSLATNPSLSIMDELRFLHARYHDLSADKLLALGTINGAVALGMKNTAGVLAPGRPADFAVFSLATGSDSWESCFADDRDPLAVLANGSFVR